MADEKIKVTVVRYSTLLHIKLEKDDFETTVNLPVGDKVSSKNFALAATALHQAATVFHHRIYARLREKMDALNRGFEKSPAIFEKDQRGG